MNPASPVIFLRFHRSELTSFEPQSKWPSFLLFWLPVDPSGDFRFLAVAAIPSLWRPQVNLGKPPFFVATLGLFPSFLSMCNRRASPPPTTLHDKSRGSHEIYECGEMSPSHWGLTSADEA